MGHGRRRSRLGIDVDRGVGRHLARGGIIVRAARPERRRRQAGHVNLGFFAAQVDGQLTAADGGFVGRIQRIDEFRSVRLGDLRVEVLVAVLDINRHQRLFLVIDPAERIRTIGVALLERTARQALVGGACRVQRGDVLVQRRGRRRQLVALRGAGLKALVEHTLALPVAVVGVVGRGTAAVVVPALVEGVLGAVVQTRHRRGQIEEAQRRPQLVDVVARVATVHQGNAVQIVVVNKRHQAVGAFAVLPLVIELLGELPRPAVVHEYVLDRLADREEQGGIVRVARVLAPTGQRVVVIGKQLTKEDEVVLAARCRVLAHVIGPLLVPVVFHVLDGIHAEAVAVRRVDQVLEGLREDALHRRVFRLQVVRALELSPQVFRRAVPVVNRPVVVEIGQGVERRGMFVVLVPPPEGAVAIGKVLLVVLLVIAPQPVLVAHVVGRHIENDVNANRMQRIDQLLQVLERAHRRVALEKVFRMVLVIGRVVQILALVVHLYTGHPDRLHAHAGQVADVVFQPLPIAAVVEVAVLREVLALGLPTRLVARQLVGAGIREAIREQLVDIDVAPVCRTRRVAEAPFRFARLESVGGIVHPPVPNARFLPPNTRHHRQTNHHTRQPYALLHRLHRGTPRDFIVINLRMLKRYTRRA